MGANGFQIFTQITFPHIKWAFLYGVVLCSARAKGEFGAVSVLSGHLCGRTNTMPLYIELLYQAFDFTGAFALSSILVIMAIIILVLRNIFEYRGKKEMESQEVTGMGENTKAYVELKHINKTFGNYKASDDVNFTVEKGKLIGLLGPSGSGKTTILRILAGQENADSGEIYIDGKQVNENPASKRGIGIVYQNYALFRYKTVFDNIAFGLKIQKKSKAEIKSRVDELIELVGLKGLEKRYPKQLSGGQRQRVAFARALATQPQLLLLDEPFAAIDAKVRKELRGWLRELINQVGITSIFVTHDQDEAIEVADEIIVTNKGKIEQIGTPVEVYSNPQTPFVVQFLGEPVTIKDFNQFKGFREKTKGDRAIIRPEFVTVTKKNEFNPYPVTTEEGIVERVAFRGNSLELTIRVHDELLLANRQIGQELIKEGEHVNVFLQRLYLVDDHGKNVAIAVNEALRQDESVVI